MPTLHPFHIGPNIHIRQTGELQKIGALTAAAIEFGMFALQLILANLTLPSIEWGLLPFWLLGTLLFTVAAAILGAVIGWLASGTTNTAIGAVLGMAVSVPFCWVFTLTPGPSAEPRDGFIAMVFHVAVPLTVAGAVVPLFARPIQRGIRKFFLSRSDCAPFVVLLAAMAVWNGYLFLKFRARSEPRPQPVGESLRVEN